MKTIVTITGIRPDFIRMSEIFKKLDNHFNHILIHTGQHFDKLLSDIFFKELEIRSPNYILEAGGLNKEHFHQTSYLSTAIVELFRSNNIRPDLVIFLGDSNSVLVSAVLKKEGYKIAHIEAGMRSGDKYMLEEINRTVCDHCSDYHFVYHEDYKNNLIKENLPEDKIFVVGNTIVEVFNKYSNILNFTPKENYIILDIHRPENFKYKNRLTNIFILADNLSKIYNLPIYLLYFPRTINNILEFGITHKFKIVPFMSYLDYLKFQYNSKFIISDSGTAQEEPALFNKPVIVPRDFTERPQSVFNNCSYMVNVNDLIHSILEAPINIMNWLDTKEKANKDWLGNGQTSEKIINILKTILDGYDI